MNLKKSNRIFLGFQSKRNRWRCDTILVRKPMKFGCVVSSISTVAPLFVIVHYTGSLIFSTLEIYISTPINYTTDVVIARSVKQYTKSKLYLVLCLYRHQITAR